MIRDTGTSSASAGNEGDQSPQEGGAGGRGGKGQGHRVRSSRPKKGRSKPGDARSHRELGASGAGGAGAGKGEGRSELAGYGVAQGGRGLGCMHQDRGREIRIEKATELCEGIGAGAREGWYRADGWHKRHHQGSEGRGWRLKRERGMDW